MEIQTVEGGKLVSYQRTGMCTRCGECCCNNTITYQVQVASGDEEGAEKSPWSDWEGWHLFFTHGIWWFFDVHSVEPSTTRCPELDDNNRCKDWGDADQFKPICRYWPFHPDNIASFPRCGFSFQKENSDESVR